MFKFIKKWMSSKRFIPRYTAWADDDAIRAIREANDTTLGMIERHRSGDFGEVSRQQRKLNRDALQQKSGRVVSQFQLNSGVAVRVLTVFPILDVHGGGTNVELVTT